MQGKDIYKPDYIGVQYNGWHEIDLSKATEDGYVLNTSAITIPTNSTTPANIYYVRILFPTALFNGYVIDNYTYKLDIEGQAVNSWVSGTEAHGYMLKTGIACDIASESNPERNDTISNNAIKFILKKTKIS